MPRIPSTALALSLLCALSLAAPASAEIYRWTDDQGERHLVGNLWEVPEPYREQAAADARSRSGGSVNTYGGDPPSAPAAGAPAKLDAPSATATAAGHPESWWRAEATQYQRAVEDADAALEAARAEEADDAGQIYGRAAPGPRGRRSVARAATLSADSDDDTEPSVQQLETAAAAAQRNRDDFHEQARRAGVPPGWLR